MDDVSAAGATVQALVDGVRDEQWHNRTPCTDWDVRQLVSHFTFGNRMAAEIFTGVRQGPPTPEERGADHLGDDPSGAYRASLQLMVDAMRAAGFSERTYRLPVGEVPGDVALLIRLTELLVHGWDLARSTDQACDFSDDVAAQVLAITRQLVPAGPRQGGPFGDERPVAESAPATDRLAAFLGRAL